MAIISKYSVYYTKKVPKKLEEFIFCDRNILSIKEGLSEIKGFKCPKISLQVFSINTRVDKQRILEIDNLLFSLIKSGSLEHFSKF